ncbi:SDR family oxidoreductase [Hamadaea tsunoensis]|uniref:SDR family oxidoreductase n=1 Tax=Hamadaea tsunoensis TaxID=53368 RepID=UPI00040E8788|nr:SDR family oxidoreductase [Hamadaea tsunoensis]
MQTGLTGKTALVTGASRGIGRAAAFALAAEGANVVLTSRRQESLDAVAAEIRAAYPVGVLAKAAHVGEPEQAAAAVEATVAEFGGVDILVNNAGTNPYFGPMVDLDVPRAEKTVQVNQLSIVLWTQTAWYAGKMSERGGSIVNIASVGGLVTELGIGYYNATKAAVVHLTRQFAAELAPKVRVNAIAPGIVRTQLARALWENHEEMLNGHIPLGRIGEPEDIAQAITFLAGDTSSWMTGQTLVIDGGAVIRPALSSNF